MGSPAGGFAFELARARAAHAAGDLATALDALELALRIEPRHAELWTGMAELLHDLGRDVDAQAAIERALALAPDDRAASLFGSIIANGLGDATKAEAILRRLLTAQPFDSAARANLASLLERGNRHDDAEREAREGLKSAPHEPLLNLVVAQCAFHRRDFDSSELFLGRVRDAPGLIPQHAAYLAAQLLDARGRPAEAYAAFADANRVAAANSARVGIDPARSLAQLVAELGIFSDEWVAGWDPLEAPTPLPFTPAFLIGFPRSGTTLLEQILDAHPGIAALDEQPFLEDQFNASAIDYPWGLATLAPAERESLRAGYAASVLRYRPEAAGRVVVDKYPLKLARVGAIHRLLPEARYILALRHPYDVVLSCFMQEFGANPAMANFFTLEGAARYYDAAMALWQRHRAQHPLAVVTVRYEALVDDLESQVRPALEHLGVGWDARVEGFAAHALGRGWIRTPSYQQVSQGLYTSARARFTKYLPHFSAEARALLDPWVARHGYAPVD